MIRILHRLRRRTRRFWDGCSDFKDFLAFRTASLFRRLGRSLGSWRRDRKLRYLLQGLPALLTGTGVIVLAAVVALTPKQGLAARYQQEAARTFHAGDYQAALRCYERLTGLKGEQPEIRYAVALTVEAMGQHDQASAILDTLAPADRQGYAPAHLWQARRLLAGGHPTPDALQAAEVHLRRTLQAQPEQPEAHALLGQLYLAGGRVDRAEKHLALAAKAQPELSLGVARLYAARGQKELARAQAERAVQFFRPQAEAALDNDQARLNWAAAAALLEDFAGAVAVLQEGQAAQAPTYRAALAEVYAAWSDARALDPKAGPGDRLVLLEQGLHYDPSNLALLQRVIAFTRVNGPEAELARAALQQALAQGKAAATVHTLLGMDAWQRGKTDEARLHYEQAYRLDPQLAAVGNNLAWALAFTQPADLPRALALIDAVMERFPNDLAFRDTRGRILAQMGRWKEALADLEAVLPQRADNRDLHRTLADVYQHLGITAMAAEHQRLAEAKP